MSPWLAASALLMGVAGAPHCLAMCGAACAVLARPSPLLARPSPLLAWQAGRAVSYAVAGAVVAGSVSLLADWGGWLPWLRPWWVLLHLAALALGLWMLATGRTPPWLSGLSARASLSPAAGAGRRVIWLRAGGAGLAWAAMPCGLLHAALLSAALASSPAGGALVMVAFAVGSGIGLAAGPALLQRLAARGSGAARPEAGLRLAVRLAGALLAVGSAWAVGHDVLRPWIDAFCR